jgi:hypothetical protein
MALHAEALIEQAITILDTIDGDADSQVLGENGAPERIRTSDPQIRSLLR